MKKVLAAALATLSVLAPHIATQAADVFWFPIHDGQTLQFLQSGHIEDSDGGSSSWGPEPKNLHIQAVDVQLLDHHADWHIADGDPRFTGDYLMQTAGGLFRVSDGDPTVDAVYRYYTDPQPWLYLLQPLEIGQPVSYSGLRRGQRAAPGGGNNVWSGTWSMIYTHLGSETVTTPLGTFDALKLQMLSSNTTDASTAFPNGRGRATWDELRWFVPDLGFVKVQGSGIDESDFNGDGIVDRWQRESQTILAVPEPTPAWSLLTGLAALTALIRRRGRWNGFDPVQ